MKGKAVIPLVVGLCIGLFAVRSGLNAIKSAQGNAASAEKITAIRTMRDIGIGEEIKDDMVELVKTVPNEFIPSMDRIETLEDVLGRVTEKSIPMGGAVLHSMLAPIGTPAGIGGQIPAGFRAFSAQIDEVSLTVEGEILIRGDVLDDLDLVVFALFFEQLDRVRP